jgi:DNA-binding LacI/PurR family transcriptional regulator
MSSSPMPPQAAPESGKVTIYDVAQHAGVSITTVSHVLNRPERVSARTREHVLAVADTLGFTPKQAAVALARKGVGRIGVLGPFTSYASYGTRLTGVLEACANDNVDLVVFDAPSVATAASPLLRSLPVTGRLDGMLIMGVPLEEAMARRLARRKLATVLVDSLHKEFDWVNVDDEAGGHQVGTHLLGRGHRSIAYVSEGRRSSEYVSPGQLRRQGLVRALREGGLGEEAMQWVVTGNGLAGGREAAASVLRLDPRPTAVFAHHDELAAGLLVGLREAGLRVPEDIAVVGYDGTLLSEALGLTSVHQPLAETGRRAAELLLARLGESAAHTTHHINLAPALVVRATT